MRVLAAVVGLMLFGASIAGAQARPRTDFLQFRTTRATAAAVESTSFTCIGSWDDTTGTYLGAARLAAFDTSAWIDTRQWDWQTPGQGAVNTTAYAIGKVILYSAGATFSAIDTMFVAFDWGIDPLGSEGGSALPTVVNSGAYQTALPITAGEKQLSLPLLVDADDKATPWAVPFLRLRFRADGNQAAIASAMKAAIVRWNASNYPK